MIRLNFQALILSRKIVLKLDQTVLKSILISGVILAMIFEKDNAVIVIESSINSLLVA